MIQKKPYNHRSHADDAHTLVWTGTSMVCGRGVRRGAGQRRGLHAERGPDILAISVASPPRPASQDRRAIGPSRRAGQRPSSVRPG